LTSPAVARLARTGFFLLCLALLAPSAASATHTAYLDAVTPNAARCQVKGLFGIPVPSDGTLTSNYYAYIVTTVTAAGETGPACPPVIVPVNNATAPAQNSVLLQWNATPGAAAYKIYRGTIDPATGAFTAPPQALIFAAGPPLVTALPPNTPTPTGSTICPPAGAGPRCFFQDKGGPNTSGQFPPPQAAVQTQAGSHPDLTITQRIDYGGVNPNSPATDTTDDPYSANPATHTAALKTDHFEFPPGLVANPRATATCALTGPNSLLGDPAKFGRDDLNEDRCPRSTLVGTVSSLTRTPSGITPTQGDIYNGATKAGEAGRLFIVLRPLCSNNSPVSPGSPTCQAVIGGGDVNNNPREVEKQFLAAIATITRGDDGTYGIDVDVREAEDDHDLAKTLNVLVPNPANGNALVRGGAIPIQVRQITQRLFGYADQGTAITTDDVPFVTLPTSCGVKTMYTDKTTHDDAVERTGSRTFTTTGCENVPFDASTEAEVDTTQVEAPVGFANSSVLGTPDDPIHQSHIRKITATFPEGLVLSSSSGTAIQAVGAKLGSVTGFSDELGELTGTLTLQSVGTDAAGHFNGSMIVRATVTDTKPGSDTVLVLDGPTTADPATGRLTAVFDNLPEVPFKRLKLAFDGGPNAPLVNPPTCGTHTVRQDLVPWSGNASKTAEDTFTTSFDGAGAACPDKRPFSPTLAASASPTQAGAFTALTTKITRGDREQALAGFTLELPKGMLAKLGTVPFCPGASADAGTCAASTQVGSVKIAAGTGTSPVELPGTISLAEPVTGSGDVASLVVAIPVKVGPFDVGTVVSRARLQILFDPEVGVRVTTTGALPTIAGGIPVRVRTLELTIDKAGFQRNPSSCEAKQFRATFTSQGDPTTAATRAEGGATSVATAPFGATGCDALPFAPQVSGTIDASGDNDDKGDHPGLSVTVSQKDDEAATRSANVKLPATLTANVAGLEKPCASEAQLAADQCPAEATVGQATATSPLVPVPLSGPIVAVARANDLPTLAVLLRGPLSVRLDAIIELDTSTPGEIRIVNSFPSIPDVPLSTFTLDLKGGAGGLLTNATSLCSVAGGGDLTGTFVAHNGKQASVISPLAIKGLGTCTAGAPKATGRISKVRRGRPDVTIDVKRTVVTGAQRIRSVQLTLPKGLRIKGKKVSRLLRVTSSGKRISRGLYTARGRKIVVDEVGKTGSTALRIRLRSGVLSESRAIRRRGRSQRLTFKLRVDDRALKAFNLRLRLKPRN
jgi:hypothetical protein